MTKPDPTLALIAARFTRYDVEKSGKGYTIVDRRTANPIPRLCPIPATDRFELFYWSNAKGRWTTWKHGPHEVDAAERSRNRRERSDVPRCPPRLGAFNFWLKSSSGLGDLSLECTTIRPKRWPRTMKTPGRGHGAV